MNRETKDSGIDWIGEIPSNWNLMRIKDIVVPSRDGIRIGPFGSALTNKTTSQGEYYIYGQYNLINDDFLNTKHKISESTFNKLQAYEVLPNDICLSMMGTIGKCKMVPSNIKRGIMDSHLIKIRLNKRMLNKYFEYVYDKDYGGICFKQMQYDKTGSIMDGLNTTVVKNLYLPVPPVSEQKSIVIFLDSKCEVIDQAIQKQKDIVDKLMEYKQSMITQAVTKGLNCDKEMKGSKTNGVDEIPVTWNDMKIKYLGTFCNGLTYHPEDICDEDEGTLVLRSSNIQNGKLDFNDNVYVKCLIPTKIKIKKGDIIICSRNGSAKLIGKNALITDDMNATFGAFMMIFRCNSPRYMYYVLNSKIWETYLSLFATTTINQLTSSTFGNLVFPYTFDKDEQCHIVEYLDDRCEKIDYAVAHSIEIIEHLEEYKKSLIYNVVTGKIDCRGEVK